MREFIYLDRDFLESAVSQVRGGIIRKSKESVAEGVMSSKTDSVDGPQTNFKAGLRFPMAGASVSGSKAKSNSSTLKSVDSHISTTHEIDRRDSDYQEYEDALLRHEKFILKEGVFELINLDSIIEIIGSEDFLSLYKNTQLENKTSQDDRKKANKTLGDIRNGLRALNIIKQVFPANLIVFERNSNCVIPLMKDNLILDSRQVSVAYRNETTNILCKYAGRLNDALTLFQLPEALNLMMQGLYGFVEEVFFNFFGFSRDTEMLFPISWYQNHNEIDQSVSEQMSDDD